MHSVISEPRDSGMIPGPAWLVVLERRVAELEATVEALTKAVKLLAGQAKSSPSTDASAPDPEAEKAQQGSAQDPADVDSDKLSDALLDSESTEIDPLDEGFRDALGDDKK